LRTPGTGETVLADEVTDATLGSGKVQMVKIMDGTLDGTTKAAVGANGLAVEVKNSSIAGTAGTPNAGVLSVQGVTSMTPLQVAGTAAHGAAAAGNPALAGAKAVSAFPAEVDTADAAYNLADMMGRLLVTHIPNTEQKSKAYNDTSSRASGAAVAALTGTSGKKLAITGFTISAYGTTAGRVMFWLALVADTTYTAGTDKPVFVGSFAPSATAKPGVVVMLPVPIFAETDSHVVMYQNDAAISLDVVWHYYEVE
jgi:hypothetical protein